MEIIEKLTKRNSFCSVADNNIYDFRKKCKCNVYKTKFKPESKEFIWEEDSASDALKKSLKKIIRKLSKRTERAEKSVKDDKGKENI